MNSVLRWLAIVLFVCGVPLYGVADTRPTVLVLGDSLSAAYGIAQGDGWVTLLQNRLHERGFPHAVINASISGETTRGGLTRLPKLLAADHPELVVIALGSNDGLRGTPLDVMKRQLAEMVTLSQAADARVLLIGNRLPPNYGMAYTDAFQQTFREVADAYDIPLIPFMLDGIATDDALLQDDRLHPTAAAQPLLLDRIGDRVETLLETR